MPTILKTKNSVTTTVVPTTLQQGELAVNITDKKMWVGNAATTPVQLLGDGGSGSFTTVNTTNLEVTNIKAKDGTASASIANSTGIFTHSTATVFTAGTVSAPAITTTGDTNTGIFFPAADTIAFTEGGVESVRITSAGDVGIGTVSPASKLDVVGTASFSSTMGVGAFAAAPETGLNVRFIGNLTSTDITGVSVSISAPATASNSTNGVYSSLRTTAASGARGSLSSFYAEQPSIGAGSSVSAANGVFVRNQGNAAIAAAYGIRIEPQSGSTVNLGIYNESSARFDGNIGLNTLPSGSGTGITFPATQSASSNANTLDDYEEGTWTPVPVPLAGAYTTTTTSGIYVKIGRQVTVNGVIVINNIGTASTLGSVSGFPFAANSSVGGSGAVREQSTTGIAWTISLPVGSTDAAFRDYSNSASAATGSTWVFTLAYESD